MDPKEYEQFEQTCEMENKIDAACDDVMDAFRENVIKRQKLDAASPELLEALREVLLRLDMEPVDAVFPCSAMRDRIRAAIAKATEGSK